MLAKTRDRELLRLAAKAAGYRFRGFAAVDGAPMLEHPTTGPDFACPTDWNPIQDDGDCARLEAACDIDIEWMNRGVIAFSVTSSRIREAFADHGGDKNAARRRASTRAAAETGKAMQ